MTFDDLRPLADALLYEGYALYPYRASAIKNRFRWQFGVLMPEASTEASWMEAQCLVETEGDAELVAKLRFLHLCRRRVEARRGGIFEAVPSLEIGGRLHVPWDEGEAHEVDVTAPIGDASAEGAVVPFAIAASEDVEAPSEDARVVRTRESTSGAVRVEHERVGPRLVRVRVRVENRTPSAAGLARDEALSRALLGAHLLLGVRGGTFVSAIDPPASAMEAARGCRSVRCFPVLVGEPDHRDRMLAAPLYLEEYPRVAPESPGDLFDATEIDEILTLRTRLLTDDEKREVRATDPRAAAVLDRVDAISPDAFAKLHGAIRELRPEAREIARGTRVRILPPARRTDAQDMFLAGLTATVERVERDVDDRTCLAVTIDGDPAAELHRWHGRYLYFLPEEVEVLPEERP